MSDFNLPPGVSVNDIPSNEPDVDWPELETPAPQCCLNQKVHYCGGETEYTIDGLRLVVATYGESWEDDESPCELHPLQPSWEYHLIQMGKDMWGNDKVREFGWARESEITS